MSRIIFDPKETNTWWSYLSGGTEVQNDDNNAAVFNGIKSVSLEQYGDTNQVTLSKAQEYIKNTLIFNNSHFSSKAVENAYGETVYIKRKVGKIPRIGYVSQKYLTPNEKADITQDGNRNSVQETSSGEGRHTIEQTGGQNHTSLQNAFKSAITQETQKNGRNHAEIANGKKTTIEQTGGSSTASVYGENENVTVTQSEHADETTLKVPGAGITFYNIRVLQNGGNDTLRIKALNVSTKPDNPDYGSKDVRINQGDGDDSLRVDNFSDDSKLLIRAGGGEGNNTVFLNARFDEFDIKRNTGDMIILHHKEGGNRFSLFDYSNFVFADGEKHILEMPSSRSLGNIVYNAVIDSLPNRWVGENIDATPPPNLG